MLRLNQDSVDYLVLFDSTLLLDTSADRPLVVSDDRVLQYAQTEREATTHHLIGSAAHNHAVRKLVAAERQHRNMPGGYWVAGTRPEAAGEAITGSVACQHVARAALMTDGAACLVDAYGLSTWPTLLEQLDRHGPRDVIAKVRQAEATDPHGRQWPRYKRSDDATIAFCRFHEDGRFL